jgi:hypothetical protein
MSGKKLGFLALTFFLVSAVLVPALLTDVASAKCSAVNSLTVVQLFNNPNDYKWYGTWDSRFDSDWQTHYRISYVRDCDVRDYDLSAARDCDLCATGDRNAARDCDRSAARDCDRCQRCPLVSDYHCDQFGCGWVRDYGCSRCSLR